MSPQREWFVFQFKQPKVGNRTGGTDIPYRRNIGTERVGQYSTVGTRGVGQCGVRYGSSCSRIFSICMARTNIVPYRITARTAVPLPYCTLWSAVG